MNELLDAFPRRPLTLQPLWVAKNALLGAILGGLVFGGLYVLNLWFFVPSLVDDIVHGDAPPVSYGHFEEGKCHSRLITICDLDIKYGVGGVDYAKSLHYLTMLSTPDDERPMVLFADPSAPENVSSNWGRDLVVNRALTQIGALALAIGIVYGVMREQKRRKTEAQGRERISAKPLPVIATIKEHKAGQGFYDVIYSWNRPGSTTPNTSRTRFTSGTEPFWMDAKQEKALALTDGSEHATLLDNGLRAVASFTPEERTSFIAMRDKGIA